MKVAVIIPARLDSQRLPRKLLREVGGKPVLQWTWEVAAAAKDVDKVVVVSPDREILSAAAKWGSTVVASDPNGNYPNGTTRVAAAARHLGDDYVGVINLQADSVTVKPEWLDRMAYLLRFKAWEFPAYTVCCDLPESERFDPSVVKVAVAQNGTACWFSRHYFTGARKHVGVYGFRRSALREIEQMPVSKHAVDCGLEQLTWIGSVPTAVIDARDSVSVGIDVEADLDKFAEWLRTHDK